MFQQAGAGYLQVRPGPGPGSADQMTGSRRSGHVGLARGRSTYVQKGRLRASWRILCGSAAILWTESTSSLWPLRAATE